MVPEYNWIGIKQQTVCGIPQGRLNNYSLKKKRKEKKPIESFH